MISPPQGEESTTHLCPPTTQNHPKSQQGDYGYVLSTQYNPSRKKSSIPLRRHWIKPSPKTGDIRKTKKVRRGKMPMEMVHPILIKVLFQPVFPDNGLRFEWRCPSSTPKMTQTSFWRISGPFFRRVVSTHKNGPLSLCRRWSNSSHVWGFVLGK